MLPTLHIGQKIQVASYLSARPAIGDIVVFHPPHGADLLSMGSGVCAAAAEGLDNVAACDLPTPTQSKSVYVKRVVAGPGDRISIADGHVIRDGVREQDPYIRTCRGFGCNYPKTIVVPPGDYYLLGDNRGASSDSRLWGPVPRSWVLARMLLR